MAKKKEFIKYLIAENVWILFLLLCFIPISLLLSDWDSFELSKEILTKTWPIFEPVVAVLTLIVALTLFVVNKHKTWEDSLPKRLTAIFVSAKNNTLLMKAENFPLAGEWDLRAWGQQLGAQILFGDRSLQYFKLTTSSKVNQNGTSKDYEVTFYLEEIPALLKDVNESNEWVLLKGDGKGGICRTRLPFNSSGEGKPFVASKVQKPKDGDLKNQKIFIKEGNMIS
ncbi:hypothetical protein [Maridesulfovibrio hydrothermalis]|uniref:Uncharacterized protein n=1 Tax=Maridesulfovibrio hydrothermalis AM13 = DSM 14728 TaxID=1121451 RepID=L0R736_9BACT|nr:hypothetical protein [Maridesulfovibrio hydrothermalis]CCO22027.1 protein of unknown function [Maridesulfovibrio hydrothermalis AM13 = DSM 14728]